MLLSGPDFIDMEPIRVFFDNIPVNCMVVIESEDKRALCISPRLSKAGQVSVKLERNSIQHDSTFYASKLNIIISCKNSYFVLSRQ